MSSLGNLFFNIAVDHATLTAGLTKSEHEIKRFADRSKKNINDFESSVKETFGNIAKIAGGAFTFGALANTLKTNIAQFDSLTKTALKTGSSFEELSRQQRALQRAGEDFTTGYAAGLNKLSQNLGSFNKNTITVLNALGVSTKDASGKLKDTATVAREAAQALQGYESGVGKTAAVTALFGKAGADLIPVLDDLANEYNNVTGLSGNFAKQVEAVNDKLDLASAQATFFGQNLTVALLPSIIAIGDAFSATGIDAGSFGNLIGQGLSKIIQGVSSTFTLFVSVIHGTGAALKELFAGNFSNVGNAFREVQGSYDKTIESLFKGQPVIAATVKGNEDQKKSLDGLAQKLGSADAATKSLGAATKAQISDADKFMQSLNREVEQLNKSQFEIKKLEAAKLGLSKVADPLITKIERETAAFKKQQELMAKGRSITEANRTSQEIFNDTQRELNDLLKTGNITQETYNRALAKAGDEIKKTGSTAAQIFPSIEEMAIQASRNIQNAFSNAFRLGIEGDFKGMVTSFKAALLQMVAEAASIDFFGLLFGRQPGQTSALAGLFSAFGGSTGGSRTGGGLSNLSSLFSLGGRAGGASSSGFMRSLAGLFGLGGASASGPAMAFTGQTFLGGPNTALGGAGLAGGTSLSAIAGPLIANLIGWQIGASLAGGKKVLGLNGTALAGIGMILGGPVGALIGGSLGALFGRGPLKQKETNLIGSFGADGFEGTTSTKFKAQGGLLVGDKVVRLVADVDTGKVLTEADGRLKSAADSAGLLAREIGIFINGQWKPIVNDFRMIADGMGLASSAVEAFNFQVNIASEKGEALTKEQIGAEIAEAADNLARSLVPAIDDLRKGTESASQALNRLYIQFDELTQLAVVRGMNISSATDLLKNTSVADQSAFYDSLGITNLGSKSTSFLDQFGSDQFKQTVLENQLKQLLAPFPGATLAGIDTREEVLGIVQSLDLSTDQGRKALKAILDNQDLILRFIESQEAKLVIEESSSNTLRNAAREQTQAAKVLRQAADEAAQKAALEAVAARARANTTFEAALLNGQFDVNAGLASQPISENFAKFFGRSFKTGEFNAGAFNYEYAIATAEAARRAMDFASQNALKIINVQSLLGQLRQTMGSRELLNGFTQERVRMGIDPDTARFLAGQYSRNRFQSRAPGIASVFAAQDNVGVVSASGYLNGIEQRGADVIAYGNALNLLNKQLKDNLIDLTSFNEKLKVLNREFGSDVSKLLNNTEAQMERIIEANRRLGQAGVSSIRFYFKQITDSVKEFGAGLSEPAQQINESSGRLNSLRFVMQASANAAISGYRRAGEFGRVQELTKQGGLASIANLIGKAAGIASGVLNTQTGQLVKAGLDSNGLFKGKDTKALSLLIEGVRAFDSGSFENAFNNINAALINKKINEAQFTNLFNTALDMFEGLSGAAGASAEALADLRKAANSLADDLLADPSKNVGSPFQAFNIAESQFNSVIKRARAGDVTATAELSGAAQNLLAAGQNSLADQTSLIGYVQANLRSVGATGGTARLTVDPATQAQLDAQQKRLDAQDKVNGAILSALDDMRATYRKWDALGLPTTAV